MNPYAPGDRQYDRDWQAAEQAPKTEVMFASEMTRAVYEALEKQKEIGVGNRDPNSDTYASDTWADITRAQWRDYMTRSVPKENKLMGMLTYERPRLERLAVREAKQEAGQSFDATNKLSAQYRRRSRMAMSPGSLAGKQRSAQIHKQAKKVSAANQARQDLQDRNREIALGMSNAATTAAGEYR